MVLLLGCGNNNTAGKQVIQLLDRGYATHEGPLFPTYITHRSKTSPDIILANSSTFHNTYSGAGPLTPSDHIPIIFTISTSPIQIPVRERTNFVRADWEKYRELLRSAPLVDMGDGKTEEEVEQAVTTWTHQIQEASRQAIPKTAVRTVPHYRTSHLTRALQVQHDALLMDIATNGPSYNKNLHLINLRHRIGEEYRRLRTEAWNSMIERTDTERNSKDFWTSIKRMIGQTTSKQMNYLKNSIGHNLYYGWLYISATHCIQFLKVCP